MKILIVDDSSLYRSLIESACNCEDFEIVGKATNGLIAMQYIRREKIDVVILDIEMPEMDGIATVKQIRGEGFHEIKIIIFSSLTRRSTKLSIEAIYEGANEVAAKPESKGPGSDPVETIRSELLPKLRQFFESPASSLPAAPLPRSRKKKVPAPGSVTSPDLSRRGQKINLKDSRPRLIAVASSTGGPNALRDLFTGIGDHHSPPVLIAQHMPPLFTKTLAEKLDEVSGYRFKEAEEGEAITNGNAYIAPGDYHMVLEPGSGSGTYKVGLHQGEKVNFVRPAADVLFNSVAEEIKQYCLGIVLTGMGSDGMHGSVNFKNNGSGIFIQDEKSCVVWGMARSVHSAEAFDEMGNIDDCRQILSLF